MMDAGSCMSMAALPGWANVGLEDARAILDNCSVAVHFVDANGTIIYANKAELDCLGTSSSESRPPPQKTNNMLFYNHRGQATRWRSTWVATSPTSTLVARPSTTYLIVLSGRRPCSTTR